jgi:hypothetical protein
MKDIEVTSHVFYHRVTGLRVSLITVTDGSENDKKMVRDVFYSDYVKPLYNKGYSESIQTKVKAPEDCQLSASVVQVEGNVSATDWISQNSNYTWEFKSAEDMIEFGRSPRHIGTWNAKD